MLQRLEQSVIRILNIQDKTVGTGFVVADHLAVTCAHVVQAAGSTYDQPIRIRFYNGEIVQVAQVLRTGWSSASSDDVALLQLDHLPDGIVPVVLGSASQSEGHPYCAFGFTSLAGYDNRKVNDTLDGTVSVKDKHKRPMLQLKGEEIDQGLSGAPILDTQTDRVVGMVSEYQDNARTRFAWATTADTLVDLHTALQLWPETFGPRELDLYLRYLIETNQWLKLPDGYDVPLERVYISLKADEMSATEWKAEQALYLEDLAAIRQEIKAAVAANQYTEFEIVRKAILRHPKALKLTTRDWAMIFSEHEQRSLTLAKVIQHHTHVVILGDPGSGKTTLGKWLVLQHAWALLQHLPHIQMHADMVTPGADADTLLDLGPTRLPIFIRIADYTRARWSKEEGDNRLPLERFIGLHENKKDLPAELSPEAISAMAQSNLAQGRALVILDGLDEVGNLDQRRAVMQEVKHLLRARLPHTPASQDGWGGNHLLLTSRIVGYQFDPLAHLPHYTVEPMDKTAITAFCHAWIRHVAGINSSETVEQTRKLKNAIFDHAHPGVQVLAGNPLLLTILVHVYWSNPQRGLPATRVALFREAEQTLYQQRKEFWDRAGIPQLRLTRALASVATYIHANEPIGFAEESDMWPCLRAVIVDDEQVEAVLEAAREASGFLVARGEGIYSFLHRALQEYFVAQHLVSQPEQASRSLVTRSLEPIWREPIVLAVGIISQHTYPESRRRLPEVFAALLDASDPVGDFLPRRELLVAAACAECERIPPGVGKRIAEYLLTCYAQREGRGRSPVMRQRIRRAFISLQRSPAASETELVLSSALQARDFERRFAAVDLVIETEWDSRAIAEALVSSWRTYADPARSLLVALEGIYTRHPIYFTDAILPLRQMETAFMWERGRGTQDWQAVLRILYLPPGADCTLEQVNRDSPLTKHIIATLGQVPGPEALVTLHQQLLSLAGQQGTAQGRDATLALSALGDTSWLPEYVQSTGAREDFVRPLLASLAFTLDRALDFADNLNSKLAYDARPILEHDLTNAFAMAIGRASTRSLDPTRDRDLDLVFDRHYPYNLDLARARELAHEIGQNIEMVYRPQADDASVIQYLELTRSVQRLQHIIDFLEPLNAAWSVLIAAYDAHWPQRSKSLIAIRSYDEYSEVDSQGRLADDEEYLINSLFKWGQTFSLSLLPASAKTQITLEGLTTLVDNLVSPNDARREYARQVLQIERQASTLEQSIIEHMATLARVHASNHQVGTQLNWALQSIRHDRSDWLRTWLVQASKSEDMTPALAILSTIQHVTPETFATLIETLPKAAPWVQKALLNSMSWLVRLRRIPQEYQALLQEQLLIWLDQETDPTICRSMIDILGHWQEPEGCRMVGMKLLDRLTCSTSESENTAVYEALARLAICQPELVEPVRTALLRESPQPGATAALVRLSLAKTHNALGSMWFPAAFLLEGRRKSAIRLLNRLSEIPHNPAACLAALLDAGIDNDPWIEDYHGVLAIAARMHLEYFSNLLNSLLTRLQQTLEQENWPAHRMVLAAVAASMEVMPTALQQAGQGKLESLLIRGATTLGSFNSRRFALTALSYLRVVTPAVVPALLAGCQDVEVVQRDTIEAASRFQSIKGDLLSAVIPTLRGESIRTAYAMTQLLGALGTSAAGETAGLHRQIIEALVEALRHPNGQREVVIAGQDKGKLEDTLYIALLKVAEWTG